MKSVHVLFWLLIVSSFPSVGRGQVKLPRLISDGMVLQRDQPVKLWGWAAPGEAVTLSFGQQTYAAHTGESGKWSITLPPQPPGGPHEMAFSASNTIRIKDILFGDVWVCSGQSNMELPMERVQDKYAAVVANANDLEIRQFLVPDKYNFQGPEEDVSSGQWQAATNPGILSFSAVAYFFAKELYETYHIPIGLINSALGGSPAEAWISEDALSGFPAYQKEGQKFKDQALIDQIENKGRTVSADWYARLNRQDKGLANGWAKPGFDHSAWPAMNIPGYWADAGAGRVNGIVWFRKDIDLPSSFAGKPARLWMGRIVDADSVFVNGVFTGTTTYQYPPRRYSVPAGVLKAGKNTIAVRVVSNGGKGGFVPDKPYELIVDQQTIDLKGQWAYQIGATIEPLPGQPTIRWKPFGLYNAMIAPLLPYRIKGVIWYQGESNTGNPADYTDLMTTLIQDWRSKWGQGEFPFLFVQLANFMEPRSIPAESNWAALRQAQLATLSTPNTGMAVAIDLGEWNDVHPLNKLDVGKRLALQAKKLAYGDDKTVCSGPLYRSMQVKGNKAILSFDHTGSGLQAKEGTLKYFSVAGSDGKFVWAKAEIKGKKVLVYADAVPQPVAVRYAWADNPEGANLYNKEGLPASPFEARMK